MKKRYLPNKHGFSVYLLVMKNTVYQRDVSNDRIVLFKCKTVFPFTLFPDEIIIDKKKVSIIRDNFLTRHIDTINIVDVLKASLFHGPFFGSLELTTRFYSQKPIKFTHLKKADALTARSLIQGLIIATEKKMDLELMEKKDVYDCCMNLGKAVN